MTLDAAGAEVPRMKAALARDFGRPEDVLYIQEDAPRPQIKPGSGQVLVRVQAASLSPGDWRNLSGSASAVRKPKLPYSPGFDICGVVVEVDPNLTSSKFKPGDTVVATWDFLAAGGLAEYALVDPKLAALRPPSLSSVEGSALANSAGHASMAVKNAGVKKGDRVLILGGSGGLGTAFVQFARVAGATYVAATSTDKALMTSLGVDKVIDHLHEEWWKDPEFKENPLDVIVDAAEGKVAWERAKTGILKSGSKGGRFLAVAMPNPAQEFKSILPMIGFMCETLMKTAYSRVASSMVPRFVPELATVNGALLEQVLKTAEAGRLKVVLDPGSPFPFTKEGVVEAFKLQASTLHPQDDDKGRRGPHGKIVIKISDE